METVCTGNWYHQVSDYLLQNVPLCVPSHIIMQYLNYGTFQIGAVSSKLLNNLKYYDCAKSPKSPV